MLEGELLKEVAQNSPLVTLSREERWKSLQLKLFFHRLVVSSLTFSGKSHTSELKGVCRSEKMASECCTI